ncbi:hypothetical protein [Lutibaculum baratangense]|uniref:DUF1127 domain-containing protein n=1 Tax=Lutibaculum baratangense AMV1 TaxID=631454 RepID=V4RHZ5_9HYPH|nr:hypothetical protein [Lutibaculum baratangense]ESR24944.1 hypothetical protein N177_2267 [Lutibaculum baratangense AMV1]
MATTYAAGEFQPRKTRSITAFFRGVQKRMGLTSRRQGDVLSLRNADDRMLADLGLNRGQLSRILNATTPFAGYDQADIIARNQFRRI